MRRSDGEEHSGVEGGVLVMQAVEGKCGGSEVCGKALAIDARVY